MAYEGTISGIIVMKDPGRLWEWCSSSSVGARAKEWGGRKGGRQGKKAVGLSAYSPPEVGRIWGIW